MEETYNKELVYKLSGKGDYVLGLSTYGNTFVWKGNERIYDNILDDTAIGIYTNGVVNATINEKYQLKLWLVNDAKMDGLENMEVGHSYTYVLSESDILDVMLFKTFALLVTSNTIHSIPYSLLNKLFTNKSEMVVIPKEYITMSYKLSTKAGMDKITGYTERIVFGDDFFAILSIKLDDRSVRVLYYGTLGDDYYDEITDLEIHLSDLEDGLSSIININISNNVLYLTTTKGVHFLHYEDSKVSWLKDYFDILSDISDWDMDNMMIENVNISDNGLYLKDYSSNLFYLGERNPILDNGNSDEDYKVFSTLEEPILTFRENMNLYKLNTQPIGEITCTKDNKLLAVRDMSSLNIHILDNGKVTLCKFPEMMFANVYSHGNMIYALDVGLTTFHLSSNADGFKFEKLI